MNLDDWMELLLTATAYLYFHWSYFSLIGKINLEAQIKRIPLIGSFLFIYAIFSVCSFMELHLVANWILFFLSLFMTTLLFCPKLGNRQSVLMISLSGIYYALLINIFSRCVIALMVNKPLSSFDNNVFNENNLKALPVMLSFFLAGALIHQVGKKGPIRKKKILLKFSQQVSFLNKLLIGLVLYLNMNLLLYQTAGNEILLKVWGLKSCTVCAIGFYMGMQYALRMSELALYREETRRIEKDIEEKEREEKVLNQLAFRDALTGCYNRAQASSTMAELIESKTSFTLCFIDLDRLKYVNDFFHHQSGDDYLNAVVKAVKEEFRRYQDFLFRYGGDEFLLLLVGIHPDQGETGMRRINEELNQMANTADFPFPMSISFGIASSMEAETTDGLIALADQRMYHHKQLKKNKKDDL